MRVNRVEIFSDKSNAAVLRHPERRFPGVLLQGDTLYGMCQAADQAYSAARGVIEQDQYEELNDLRNHLWELLVHYKQVLVEHNIPLPFVEAPRA